MKLQLFFYLVAIFFCSSFPQEKQPKSTFFSTSLGFYRIDDNNFSKVYGSNSGLTPSITLGLPIFSDVYMFGKVTYFYKEGVPIINHYSWENGSLREYQTQNGEISFKEFIIDGGFFLKIFLSPEYAIDLMGGIVYFNISEKGKTSDNVHISNSPEGIFGPFLGVGVERNFGKSPFSLSAELQYGLSFPQFFHLDRGYGGISGTMGLRFYFKERRFF